MSILLNFLDVNETKKIPKKNYTIDVHSTI